MGGFVTRMLWGDDHDELSPLSGLSQRDIYQIQRSWRPIYNDAAENGQLIFTRLFKADPSTQQLFKELKNLCDTPLQTSIVFKAHAINVMSNINCCVVHLNQPDAVMVLMQKLGKIHQSLKVTKEQYLELKVIFMDILRNDLKSTEQVLQSWTRCIDFIYVPLLESAYVP